MFRNREDAAHQLAQKLKGRPLRNPVVLAIPGGGVVIGAVLARQLGADLDVLLARKLRAPEEPELAIGAVAEDGKIYLNQFAREVDGLNDDYLLQERDHHLAEIARRQQLFRKVRPPAPLAGRSVIVTDDGIATGATVIAALRAVGAQQPFELIVAAPVAAPDRIHEVSHWCDEVVCIVKPPTFWSIGQFYADFAQVEDEQAIELLRAFVSYNRSRPPQNQPWHESQPACLGDQK